MYTVFYIWHLVVNVLALSVSDHSPGDQTGDLYSDVIKGILPNQHNFVVKIIFPILDI